MNKSIQNLPVLLENLRSLDNEIEASPDILGRIFDTAMKLNDLIEDSDLPSNEKLFQESVKVCIHALEKCTYMVNELDLFSSNESIEEVQTSSIRYLMLPAILGNLNLALQNKERRFEFLEIAEVYFRDFLLRCKNYELSKRTLINRYENEVLEDYDANENNSKKQTLIDLVAIRESKIQQYRLRKELKDREIELKPALGRKDAEEQIREYYLVILERWMLTAMEELGNIKSEKSLQLTKQNSAEAVAPVRNEIKPLKPIIITRNEIQKKVFGLGYPSLPVMTIDDYYRQQFESMVEEHQNNSQQCLQDMAVTGGNISKEEEEIEKENLLDKDDYAALQKDRAWDDWKDDNPRGSGNRKNKG